MQLLLRLSGQVSTMALRRQWDGKAAYASRKAISLLFQEKNSMPAELCCWWKKCKNIMQANVTICGWMSDLSAWQLVVVEGGMLCISSSSLTWIAEVLTQVTVVDCVHLPLIVHTLCGDVTGKLFSKFFFLSITSRLESQGRQKEQEFLLTGPQ